MLTKSGEVGAAPDDSEIRAELESSIKNTHLFKNCIFVSRTHFQLGQNMELFAGTFNSM